MNNAFSEADNQDKRLGVLLLLFKLSVIGRRKQSYSIASTIVGRAAHVPPPCSIQLAAVSLSLDCSAC
jgi:hypothetical protein